MRLTGKLDEFTCMRFRGAGAGLKPFYGIIDIAKIYKRHLCYMVYYKYINVCLSNISYYSTLSYINDIHFINSILNDKSFSLSTYHNPFVLMCLEFKLWIRKKAAARKNERILSIVMNIFFRRGGKLRVNSKNPKVSFISLFL